MSKKIKAPKPRNWLAVHAFQRNRKAGGFHGKSKYSRKTKHKGASYESR